MLSQDEYLEIKEFLRHRVCEINRSENYDRKKQREKNTKYSLPNADSFGWMPAITICSHFYVGSAEELPFSDNYFDVGLCVGSVINYCDPLLVISEISRVLKPNAVSVLDFEQSRSYQFIGSSFNCNARIITSFNSGVDDRIWIFSERIIRSYCKMHGLKVKDVHYFHLLTPLIYLICKDENKAANFTFADKVLHWIPYLRKISCNVILTVQKSAK